MRKAPRQIAPVLLFIQLFAIFTEHSTSWAQRKPEDASDTRGGTPGPLATSSYLSLDGLNLVIIFDKPVNISSSVESVEQRFATIESGAEQSQRVYATANSRSRSVREQASQHEPASSLAAMSGQEIENTREQVSTNSNQLVCRDPRSAPAQPETNLLVQGIQICAKLLTKKTLKLLHKYHLYNCVWPTQAQFIIQLSRPASREVPIRVTFQKNTIAPVGQPEDRRPLANERELSIELNKLPLESLGIPLSPKLALTGPNQVPPCGQFSLSAHLSSPYGTQPGESVSLTWSVDRVGFMATPAPAAENTTSAAQMDQEGLELKWRALQHLVSTNKGNNLLLDSHLLQLSPQTYLFRVTAAFSTSLTQVLLNATHHVSKIDFDAPIGAIYGSHLLAQQPRVNTNQEIVLLADVQVPECASNIKQVGAYWQVSDSRVRFEQTYAPFYVVKRNALPEQAQIEFRMNLFYGIRVKKFASASAIISTGDSSPDAQISDGLLVMSIGQDPDKRLELYAAGVQQRDDNNRYSYHWSCFDGKTAQQCHRNSLASNATRYELSSLLAPAGSRQNAASSSFPSDQAAEGSRAVGPTSAAAPLIERQQQRDSILRLPLSWLEPEAQLWFGLQKFDRLHANHQPAGDSPAATSTSASSSKAEYALVSLQSAPGPTLSIGPVLVGRSRQRTSLRNPLTGAMIIVAGAPVVIVGRLSPLADVATFAWHMPNAVQPLHWTSRNATNQLSGEQELVTELHLDPSLLVAYAHHQVQLLACSRSSGSKNSAALSFDIVASVSQCRVEVNRSALSPGSLVVSVEFCNLPPGLAPATYQIYAIDTTAHDGFIDESRLGDNSVSQATPQPAAQEDEHLNEADDAFLEQQAEPLTMPSLSPVFVLNGLSGALGLLAARGSMSQSRVRARVRLAARVCDRLQSCRMFYSGPVGPEHLTPTAANQTMPGSSTSAKLIELERSQTQALQAMVQGARRANVAGNSIAAISILNGVLSLSQRSVQSAGEAQNERLVSGQAGNRDEPPWSGRLHDERLRELMQTSMRDCLEYGTLSLQRQFHYTDSGQTNLATRAMSRILSSTRSSLEFKYRAMRLLAQITRRSIDQGISTKLNCLADLRMLQSAYESLFGTFGQHSIDSNQRNEGAESSSAHSHRHRHTSKLKANSNNNNVSNNNDVSTIRAHLSPLVGGIPIAIGNSSALQHQEPVTQQQAPAGSSRRKREEAILAYLKYARQAYRAILSAAAIQLPLGATHQFVYGAATSGNIPRTEGTGTRASIVGTTADSQADASAPPPIGLVAGAAPSTIVSSLAHQTHLGQEPFEVNLNEYGSVSVSFVEQAKLAARLRAQLERQQLRCRNDTRTKCSSFVLVLTTFGGKAPFRSLDERLAAPIVELSLASPVDGVNLVDLMRTRRATEPGQQLQANHFKVTVTFTLNRQRNSTDANKPLRCFQFDEETNEWQPAASAAPAEEISIEVGNSNSQEEGEQVVGQENSASKNRRVAIRCTFPSPGVYGLFRNAPPPAESSIHLSILLGLVGVLALVAVCSLLGCFASSSRERKLAEGRSSSSASYESAADRHANAQGRLASHPEEAHRNEFHNYPLA